MSRQRSSRQARRRRYTQSYTDISKVELPGPLRLLTHPKVFMVLGLVFAVAILGGLMYGILGNKGSSSGSSNPLAQANEAADVPTGGTPAATAAAQPTAQPLKRYDAAPPMTIDPAKTYTAVITTTQGDVVIQLDAKDAPQTVNSFVFLASQGYYNGDPFLQTVDTKANKPFIAASGDPTGTGLVAPGYQTPAEPNANPFVTGAVGMGDATHPGNDGRFWISFGDYPAYNGKFTIFGKVVSGMDVLQKLRYADPNRPAGDVDKIISVNVTGS